MAGQVALRPSARRAPRAARKPKLVCPRLRVPTREQRETPSPPVLAPPSPASGFCLAETGERQKNNAPREEKSRTLSRARTRNVPLPSSGIPGREKNARETTARRYRGAPVKSKPSPRG